MARYEVPLRKPNIVVCMLDDVGIEAVSAYDVGTDQRALTPTIERIADEGVKFTDAYCSPTCSPTRAQLLTGLHPHQSRIGQIVVDNPPNVGLDPAISTIAKDLSAAGYATGCFGKWHLSNADWGGDDGALDLGFDTHRGALRNILNEDTYFDWTYHVDGVQQAANSKVWAPLQNVRDAMAWIETARAPWFCYLPFNSAHTPYNKPPEALYGDRPEVNKFEPNTGMGDDRRDWFLAMIEASDSVLGLLRSKLLQLRQYDDTLFIVMGDNGSGNQVIGAPYPSDRDKGTVYEGGIRNIQAIKAPFGEGATNATSTVLCNPNDLHATMADYAGLPNQGVGMSLRQFLIDPSATDPRKETFAHRWAPNGNYPPSTTNFDARALISRNYDGGTKYKLITRDAVHSPGEDLVEFYDLDADPLELTPLSESGIAFNGMLSRINAILAS